MTTETKYNGWTNYETWRVNLEMFDGFNPYDYFQDANGIFDSCELADNLKEWADEYVVGDTHNLMADYARAFLQNVNWMEISKNMIEDYSLA
jgi:hypothetical protein